MLPPTRYDLIRPDPTGSAHATPSKEPPLTLKTDPASRLVAVVVTYNRLDKLKVTLARLLAHDPADLAAVVVVDNASTDGTGDWLAQQDGMTGAEGRLDVVTSPVNAGGAGGFEMGMRRAMEHHAPDWLVVMDDDARPEPDTLERFRTMDKAGWDAFAAAVYFPEGGICEMNRPSRNPFWSLKGFLKTARRGRNGFHIPHDAYEGGICPIDVTSFVGFFVSAEAVRRVGYPDPQLFIYGDDSLYTLAMSRDGERIAFAPQLRFEHDFTTFSGSDGGQRFRPLWKVYYHHRNLLLLYRMAAGWLFWPALLVVLPKWLMKVRHHEGVRGAYLRLTAAAVRDGLTRRLGRTHAEVRALAGEDLPRAAPLPGASRSGYRGDSGPEGSAPSPSGRAPAPARR